MPAIVIGTRNRAKARQCRLALAHSGIEAIDVADLLDEVPELPETEATAEANARKKAAALAGLLRRPVLALDFALFFDGIPDADQPGLRVRRVAAGESDEEVLAHYAGLVARHGGTLEGRWEIGAAVDALDGHAQSTVVTARRTFVDRPSATRLPGYPLASLQLAEGANGRYVSELEPEEEERFWERALGRQLVPLVRAAFGETG